MSASGSSDGGDLEAALDRAVADWLLDKETEPELLPGAFAQRLPDRLRSRFLAEIEALAAIDGLARLAPARDLPRRFGDFRVLGELGRGAVGAVYEAEQVSSGRPVALKVLHQHVAGEARAAARFQREARTASALEHPGIVRVLDCGETDDITWLVMERVRGWSLMRLLQAQEQERDVDYGQARSVFGDHVALARAFADAADAFAFAHQHGVVHRDIKPANLMLRDDGRIVVLDFGLASAQIDDRGGDANGIASELTRTGELLGTPLYMAPEQAVGAENGSAQSDVYALGAVLYECLCGRPPIARGSFAVVVDAILNREPVAPHRVRAGVPQALSRIVMQCLEKRPERRYAGAAALAEDLRRYVAGQTVQARAVGWTARLGRHVRRRPLLVGLAATVLVLAPVTWWGWTRWQQSDRRVELLERDRDLARLPKMLAAAPEHITVFGGASLRHYAQLGLLQAVPAKGASDRLSGRSAGRSAGAEQALALAQSLCERFPADVKVLRARVEALLDVGDETAVAAARTAVPALLASNDCDEGDRAMAAVWQLRLGDESAARAQFDSLAAATGARVDYWRGFWHQSTQRYDLAIDCFTAALGAPDLSDEHRYFALLHRGWCQSCPEIGRLRAAQDDLLQAGALRPNYGTARLLWAALHCVEPEPDLGRAVAEVEAVLEHAEPWLHVLTARVLQSLAEAGTWQDGPVRFGSEFSPIAAVPLDPKRAAALAGLSLQLLDGVAAELPGQGGFDVAYHRITALALLGRHEEALAAVAARLGQRVAGERAALLLQRARVQLAAGRGQLAHAAVERSLDAAPEYIAAWRFGAVLANHLGDCARELACVTQAARLLRRRRPDPSVYPDAVALLPELEQRRRELLELLQAAEPAEGDADTGAFGTLLHGSEGLRALALRGEWAALPEDSPLRWLGMEPPKAAGAIQPLIVPAIAAQRRWATDASALPRSAALLPLRQAAGVDVPDVASADRLALMRLLPHAVRLAQTDRDACQALLQRVERTLGEDPQHGEARLLRAIVLFASGRAREAQLFLAATSSQFPADLRTSFVQACAAASGQDREGVRRALSRGGDSVLDLASLQGAASAVALPGAATPAELLALLR
ncbi:MAG: protein kinase [Planctomycetota bacterium]